MSDSTESSEEVTYIFNTGSSSSTSTSSNTQMVEIDHELNTEPIDSADMEVGYVENYVVNKRDSKYSDLQNLLEYGYFADPLKDLVRLHNKGLIETTEDIRKVQDMTIEITSLVKKVDKYEAETGEDYRIRIIIYFIMSMSLDPNGNNEGIYVVPNVERLTNQIYESSYVPYMKSLPKDHKHSWEVQQRERASKQFGYQVACKLARLITLGVN
jgi:hypothetical protein